MPNQRHFAEAANNAKEPLSNSRVHPGGGLRMGGRRGGLSISAGLKASRRRGASSRNHVLQGVSESEPEGGNTAQHVGSRSTQHGNRLSGKHPVRNSEKKYPNHDGLTRVARSGMFIWDSCGCEGRPGERSYSSVDHYTAISDEIRRRRWRPSVSLPFGTVMD